MAVIDGIEVGGSSYGFKAEALVSPLTINGVSFDGTDNITSYAVCSTAAGTAAKIATIGNKFVLGSGAMVTVKFTYANTASNPTLNVNGTGAAAIMINGSTAAGDEAWAEGETVAFVYDGTSWHLVGAQGPAGVGIAAGGTTNQVLAKASNDDYDTKWVNQSGGGGGSSPFDAGTGSESAVLINTTYPNTASGANAVAIGRTAAASGAYSFAAGNNPETTGASTMAVGQETQAKADMSVALGDHTIANGRSATVVGQYNVEDDSAIDTSHGAGARTYIFIIGNGTADKQRSNAMTVDWSGNGVFAGKLTVGAAPTNNMDVTTKQYVDGAIPSTAADVGAIAAPSSPTSGQFLQYNGSAWVAASLPTYNGGVS